MEKNFNANYQVIYKLNHKRDKNNGIFKVKNRKNGYFEAMKSAGIGNSINLNEFE